MSEPDPILKIEDFHPPYCPAGIRRFFDDHAAVIGVDFRGFRARGVRASDFAKVDDAVGRTACAHATARALKREAAGG